MKEILLEDVAKILENTELTSSQGHTKITTIYRAIIYENKLKPRRKEGTTRRQVERVEMMQYS